MAKRLAQHPLPQEVSVVDFGIRSYDLAYALMQDWELVILVDALPLGGEPGTLYVFEPELANAGAMSFDAHTMNPASVLQLVHALGGRVGRVLVLGCEPQTVAPGGDGSMGLSPAVNHALQEAVHMLDELIVRSLGRATAA